MPRKAAEGTHPSSAVNGDTGTTTLLPLSFLITSPPLSFLTSSLDGDLELLPWTLWFGVDCGEIAICILRQYQSNEHCQGGNDDRGSTHVPSIRRQCCDSKADAIADTPGRPLHRECFMIMRLMQAYVAAVLQSC